MIKKGTGVQGDDGKITWTYTVTVSSPHGTGDEIDFKDQLKSDAKGTSRKVKSDSLSVKKNKYSTRWYKCYVGKLSEGFR
ncbi:MAG: hypothetical protein ACLU6Y_06585 [Ruminococcus sp.]